MSHNHTQTASKAGLQLGPAAEGGTWGNEAGGAYGSSPGPLPLDRSIAVGRSRADAFDTPMPTYRVGETVSLTLRFIGDARGFDHHVERYEQLRDRVFYAVNGVTTGLMQDGTPWFLERHGRESVVVKVQPGRDTDVPGVWGIIEDFDDSTHQADRLCTLTLDIFVLADLDEYPDRRSVKDALERT